jgi:hypothetical protein
MSKLELFHGCEVSLTCKHQSMQLIIKTENIKSESNERTNKLDSIEIFVLQMTLSRKFKNKLQNIKHT